MKEFVVVISNISIIFWVGKNKEDNFGVIDKGDPLDIWFHARDTPSCHVVAKIPLDIDKKIKIKILKMGCLLCKQNTNSIMSKSLVPMIYSEIQNVKKTEMVGMVNFHDLKMVKTMICK